MAKIVSRICLFLKNLKLLVKAMSRREIYWYENVCYECNIDKVTSIKHPYHLNYVTIGKGTYISSNSKISMTTIGNFCSIGPNLLCGWGIHPTQGISTHPAFYSHKSQIGFTYKTENNKDTIAERKPIQIGNDVFIGANVTILDGIVIGDGAIIGAGTVVSKDVEPYAIVVGNPMKTIRYRFSDDIINQLIESQWWNRGDEILTNLANSFYDIEGNLKILQKS